MPSPYAVVLQDMQNYDLNRRKPASKPEPTAPVGSTILSASSSNFSQTKCTKCSEMFDTTMRKVGTGIYTICFKWSTKARKGREAAAASAAHPTPAQVAGAQASIKKAKAVLLAANVDETQRDIDTINSYIASPYYSLTVTSHPSCSTPELHFQSPTPSPIFSSPSRFPPPSLSPASTEPPSMPLMLIPPVSAP